MAFMAITKSARFFIGVKQDFDRLPIFSKVVICCAILVFAASFIRTLVDGAPALSVGWEQTNQDLIGLAKNERSHPITGLRAFVLVSQRDASGFPTNGRVYAYWGTGQEVSLAPGQSSSLIFQGIPFQGFPPDVHFVDSEGNDLSFSSSRHNF